MKAEVISVEPEVANFDRSDFTEISVSNRTSKHLNGLMFCLYNSEKLEFIPESFSLGPSERKVVQVRLKLRSNRGIGKQFVYLKSAEINKRLTFLSSSLDLDERSPSQSGNEDTNTVTSRDHTHLQAIAFQKILQEKEAYIARLERQAKATTYRTDGSNQKEEARSPRNLALIAQELDAARRQKAQLQAKNDQLAQKLVEAKRQSYANLPSEKIEVILKEKNAQITRLKQEKQRLQGKCKEYLNKMYDLEAKTHELSEAKSALTQQIVANDESHTQHFKKKLQEQQAIYDAAVKNLEGKIIQLEAILKTKDQIRVSHNAQFQILKEKDSQIDGLQVKLNNLNDQLVESRQLILRYEQKLNLNSRQGQRFETERTSMASMNTELNTQVRKLAEANSQLKQELASLTNRLLESSHGQSAINSYRVQIEQLRRENSLLQRSIEDSVATNRHNEQQIRQLEFSRSQLLKEMDSLTEYRIRLQKQCDTQDAQHHAQLMQVKAQNVRLMEKVAQMVPPASQMQQQIESLKDQVIKRDIKVQQLTTKIGGLEECLRTTTEDLHRAAEKIRQHKKELKDAKRAAKMSQESAQQQLRRTLEHKSLLTNKVVQLERTVAEQQENQQRTSSVPLSRYQTGDRKVGIKDQRQALDQSKSYQNQNQLLELRELENFILVHEEKIQTQLGLDIDRSSTAPRKTLFRLMQIFNESEAKIRSLETECKLLSVSMQSQAQLLQSQTTSSQAPTAVLEEFRDRMKDQNQKLHEALRLSNQKFSLFKKKLFQEYHSRICEAADIKDGEAIRRLDGLLNRFIDYLGNHSHKQALIDKEARMKNEARKKAAKAEERLNEVIRASESKKVCSRAQPFKVVVGHGSDGVRENVRLQTQNLTLQAENSRLKEEVGLLTQSLRDTKQELARAQATVTSAGNELCRVKQNQLSLQASYNQEVAKQNAMIERHAKKNINELNEHQKTEVKGKKAKVYEQLEQQLQRKKQMVKQLQNKQRSLQEQLDAALADDQRVYEATRENENELNRLREANKTLNESNKRLRSENTTLKGELDATKGDLERERSIASRLKNVKEQTRIREAIQKPDRDEVAKLNEEIRKLNEANNKLKRAKERETSELRDEIQKLTNQHIIAHKSLESVIRALLETTRKVYEGLVTQAKRKGRKHLYNPSCFEVEALEQVDALRIYDQLEKGLELLQEGNGL